MIIRIIGEITLVRVALNKLNIYERYIVNTVWA
jgi:hypothetical protein